MKRLTRLTIAAATTLTALGGGVVASQAAPEKSPPSCVRGGARFLTTSSINDGSGRTGSTSGIAYYRIINECGGLVQVRAVVNRQKRDICHVIHPGEQEAEPFFVVQDSDLTFQLEPC